MLHLPDIILGSKSPRRKELLQLMGLDFEVMVKETDESYPARLRPEQIVMHIAEAKAAAFKNEKEKLVITADTLVVLTDESVESVESVEILGKPKDRLQAVEMLGKLSGSTHKVFTGVTILHNGEMKSFYDMTKVSCRKLSDKEINFYIENYKPFDKAGSYGIQDWFGVNAVTQIEGSYTNVMGLPTEKLYAALKAISKSLILRV
ncbi:septum formation protein [Pedobacter sp. UYP30]|uniref:Maf family nucleotide pyrophosphatase n=1 Tax=Pedobacter sp. UYP30 TaxID=1756400 RepID=UPI003392E4CB